MAKKSKHQRNELGVNSTQTAEGGERERGVLELRFSF
jgi:hypothetical protein